MKIRLYGALVVDGERDGDFVPIEATLLPDLDMVHFSGLKTIWPMNRTGAAEVRLYDRPEDGATHLMTVNGNRVVLQEAGRERKEKAG